jgi:hypothetical protein
MRLLAKPSIGAIEKDKSVLAYAFKIGSLGPLLGKVKIAIVHKFLFIG